MRLSSTLLTLVASVTLALAKDVIVSKGIFAGVDTTDPHAKGTKIYSDVRNHATAVASILHFSAVWADFKPAVKPLPKSTAILDKYEVKVKSFPGFVKRDEFYDHLLLHGGLDDLEQQVLEGYHGYGRRVIADGLRSLIPKTLPKEDEEQGGHHGGGEKEEDLQWILTLPIIIKREKMDLVTVKLVRLAVHLITNAEGLVEVPGGQVAGLVIVELEVLPQMLKELAEDLADKLKTTSIEGFKEYFTSKLDEQDNGGGEDGGDKKKKKKLVGTLQEWFLGKDLDDHQVPLTSWLLH